MFLFHEKFVENPSGNEAGAARKNVRYVILV